MCQEDSSSKEVEGGGENRHMDEIRRRRKWDIQHQFVRQKKR